MTIEKNRSKSFYPLVLSIFSIILFISCFSFSEIKSKGEGTDSVKSSDKNIYAIEDVVKIGWKMKKGFSTEFPKSTDAKWGFFKGREVAIIRYENTDDAKLNGKAAGQEQIQTIEIVEQNKAYGPKVEKTECRGFAEYQTPYKLSTTFKDGTGYPNFRKTDLKINLDQETSNNSHNLTSTKLEGSKLPAARGECPRREPLYREFVIEGNLAILAEPLRGEDSTDLLNAINEIVEKLKENYEKNK